MNYPIFLQAAAIPNPISGVSRFFSGINLASWVPITIIAIIIIVLLIVCGIVAYFLVRLVVYNKRIVIFEKIGGKFQATRRDRAREIKIGESGDSVFYLLRHKKYLPTGTLQSSPRTYWYVIREDLEWMNFELADLDMIQRKAGAKFLDKEMRYARIALQRNLKDRYQKQSFFAQNAVLIMSFVFLAIIGILMYLLFGRFLEIAKSLDATVQVATKLQEQNQHILASLDNIVSNGGLKPAMILPLVGNIISLWL